MYHHESLPRQKLESAQVLTLKYILYTFPSEAIQGEMRQSLFRTHTKPGFIENLDRTYKKLSSVHSNHMLRKCLNVVLVHHLIKLLVSRSIGLEENSIFQTKRALPQNKYLRLLRPKSKVFRPYKIHQIW